MPEIHSICYTPKGSTRQSPDAYVRVPIESAQLIEGGGIEGDRKGKHPTRQLNIMSYEVLQGLAGEGLQVKPGQMGEQIIIKGFDVADLKPGDRVQIGDAIIEVGEYRNGCDRFQHIQSRDPKTLKGRLGIMAKVVSGGAIKVGDSIRVVTYSTQA